MLLSQETNTQLFSKDNDLHFKSYENLDAISNINTSNPAHGIIRKFQLEATDSLNYFELIDHKEIVNIEYVTKGSKPRLFILNHENHVLRCFGITRSPYEWLKKDAKKRPNLNSYMIYTWYKRLKILEELSGALKSIHAIGDLGLCGNYNKTRILIGVTSFIAPEHLKENPEKLQQHLIFIVVWIIGCCNLPYEEFKNDQLRLQFNIVIKVKNFSFNG
ncbi:kinase-like domain-containing protein [Rhizophagus irregularis DAOM 181602=DAOM 197198]|nr:kinase-like domain-containing protein [Rhizophagus irregularis DAOM 181602=DAOM 197198]